MPGRKAASVTADEALQKERVRLIHRSSAQQRLVFRARIVLAAMQGQSSPQIAQQLDINLSRVSKGRGRFAALQTIPLTEMSLQDRLADAPRPGKPAQIGPEVLCRIMALACQPPERCGRPITHWTPRELADEAIEQEIAPTISARHGGRFLKQADLKPHLSRYWLTAEEPDAAKETKIQDVCSLYQNAAALSERGGVVRTRRRCQNAAALSERGERVLSTDEMTGVQALQRKHPSLPMRPRHAERREFEYIRHGTLAFIVNFDVASGKIAAPACGPRRTEEDFLAHIQNTAATDPSATRWHFVTDNLNSPLSESLVRYAAAVSGVTDDLGEKDKRGILHNKTSRAAFLTDPSHKIVFHYTPRHCSRLNQIEIWFSILVRKVLWRGNFCSTDDLREKVLAFIAYFNQTMAKPFKWTYQGKALCV